jgi:hypothetical protein
MIETPQVVETPAQLVATLHIETPCSKMRGDGRSAGARNRSGRTVVCASPEDDAKACTPRPGGQMDRPLPLFSRNQTDHPRPRPPQCRP